MNFYCFWCDQRCHKLAFESEWWFCKDCNVRYRGDNDLLEIEFHRKIKERTYVLALEIQNNRTRIYELVDHGSAGGVDWGMEEKPLLNVKPVLNGVTADNAEQKIKTLITFS